MYKRLSAWAFVALIPLLFLSCPSNPTGPLIYERIVIDVHGPNGAGDPQDTDITLHRYEGGGLTEVEKDQTPVDPGLIDTEGLSVTSGTYYIEMYHENPPAGLGQAYAVRAISLSSGEAIPGTGVPTTLPTIDWGDTDPDEIGGETYSNTTAVLQLDINWVQRYLDAGSDTDWLKLVLP